MRVKFIRMYQRYASGQTADLSPAEYEKASPYCILIPERAAPVTTVERSENASKNRKYERRRK